MPPLTHVLGGGGSLRLADPRHPGGVNPSWFLILFLFIFWFQDPFTDILGDQQPAS